VVVDVDVGCGWPGVCYEEGKVFIVGFYVVLYLYRVVFVIYTRSDQFGGLIGGTVLCLGVHVRGRT